VTKKPRDHPHCLARVGDGHEPPQVPEVLVANGALAWLAKPFADLGALGQDEGWDLRDVDLGRQARVGDVGNRHDRSVESREFKTQSIADCELAVRWLECRDTTLAATDRAREPVRGEQVDLLPERARAIRLVVRLAPPQPGTRGRAVLIASVRQQRLNAGHVSNQTGRHS
jgi:hypothetical protein